MKGFVKSFSTVFAVSLLASTTAFASSFCCKSPCVTKYRNPYHLNGGLYFGINGGYDSYKMGMKNTLTTPIITLGNRQTDNSTGWAGGAFFGYGCYLCDLYYLGGELFVNTTKASNTQNFFISPTGLSTLSAQYKQSVGTSYGLMLLPGVKVNPSTVVYARVGYSRAYIKQRISSEDIVFNNNNWANGFAYGIGSETAVCEYLSIRGDFTHVNYGTVTSSTDPFPSISGTSKLSPSDNQYMVSLVVHFL